MPAPAPAVRGYHPSPQSCQRPAPAHPHLQLAVGGHAARGVLAGQGEHAVVERVEAGQGDELELVAQGAQRLLEPAGGGRGEKGGGMRRLPSPSWNLRAVEAAVGVAHG
jgi:hypothetical protein